ncbi:hypothetical protein MAR_005461 [Mya arenaria]|uniref:Uncharacterized protein n=1 Tax=Mya arenaria TaxID=6604 RepID=A0ABY7F7T8_MYAAR|nr:hypothetical protein MAR_005461 [Mya arenaria]
MEENLKLIGKETDESDRPPLKPIRAEQLAIPDDVDIDQASSKSATDQPVHDHAGDLYEVSSAVLLDRPIQLQRALPY